VNFGGQLSAIPGKRSRIWEPQPRQPVGVKSRYPPAMFAAGHRRVPVPQQLPPSTERGRYISYSFGKRRGFFSAPLHPNPGRRGRLMEQGDSGSAFGFRAYRPRNESTPAIRTNVCQHVCDTLDTERAFIGTDPRLGTGRRKILVAALAVWFQYEHRRFLTGRSSPGRRAGRAGRAAGKRVAWLSGHNIQPNFCSV
jgi:hypothetical protein